MSAAPGSTGAQPQRGTLLEQALGRRGAGMGPKKGRGPWSLLLAAVFLLTFLLPAFFRAGRFVVLAGLLSPFVVLSTEGAFDAAGFAASFVSVFAVTGFSTGLESDELAAGLAGTTGFESGGFASDAFGSAAFGSWVLVFSGFDSAFAESTGFGLSAAGLETAV